MIFEIRELSVMGLILNRSCFTFCDVDGSLGGMGKLITIGVIAGMLFMYGKYMTDMQQQAMQNFDAIKYQYTYAEEIASQLR